MKHTKKIATALTVLSSILVFSSFATADTFSKKRLVGTYSAWYDSSVSSYGYTGSVDAARQHWGGISSKVSISKTTTSDGNSTDEVYVGTSSTADLLGRAIPFIISWPANIICNPNVFNWDYSVISFYHNNFVLAGINNANIRQHVAIHEFGHALGLAHTTGTNSSNSIMKAATNVNETIFTPTTYDKGQLTGKWGN